MIHHPPPPRSAGGRFLALENRYKRAEDAWAHVRSSKSPADQQRYDALLAQIGQNLTVGSRQAAATQLQAFVEQALGGQEP